MKDNFANNPIEALAEIKKMMQQSTRVFSLSGWSGVWAGVMASLGAYSFIYIKNNLGTPNSQIPKVISENNALISSSAYLQKLNNFYERYYLNVDEKAMLLWMALSVFLLSVAGAIFFSVRKNKNKGYKTIYTTIARKLIINLMIPIGVGAIFCFHFLNVGELHYLVPTSLIFYGLALINSSKYTFSDIKYLGLIEIILGILALFILNFHLEFWTIGFGLLHIVYGVYMWLKYDKQ